MQSAYCDGRAKGVRNCKHTAMIPNTRFVVAVNAFPVPRSLVANISGVYLCLVSHYLPIITSSQKINLRIKHRIHNITAEIIRAVPAQQLVARLRRG